MWWDGGIGSGTRIFLDSGVPLAHGVCPVPELVVDDNNSGKLIEST